MHGKGGRGSGKRWFCMTRGAWGSIKVFFPYNESQDCVCTISWDIVGFKGHSLIDLLTKLRGEFVKSRLFCNFMESGVNTSLKKDDIICEQPLIIACFVQDNMSTLPCLLACWCVYISGPSQLPLEISPCPVSTIQPKSPRPKHSHYALWGRILIVKKDDEKNYFSGYSRYSVKKFPLWHQRCR